MEEFYFIFLDIMNIPEFLLLYKLLYVPKVFQSLKFKVSAKSFALDFVKFPVFVKIMVCCMNTMKNVQYHLYDVRN